MKPLLRGIALLVTTTVAINAKGAEELRPIGVSAPLPDEPVRPGARLDLIPEEALHRPGAEDRMEESLHAVPGATADTARGGLSTAIRRRGFQVTRTRYGALPDIQRLFARDVE